MEAIAQTWGAMSMQRRLVLIGAVVATLAMVLMLARVASQPSMSLLYGGLDRQTAGEVVAALDGMNIPNEVRGDSVYVEASQRDRVRLALAQQGLPQKGQAGYELLDQLSGFGTTSEMFQAAYWRAKEGELARTILSDPSVESARVHIGANARSPFDRDNTDPTASITVTMRGGAALQEQNALSMRFLVALAVANLEPSQVTVIDARNGVVLRPGDDRVSGLAEMAAQRRAQTIKADLERLIGVRVGVDNVQVSVSVETNMDRQTISERLLDPDSQVTMSAETEATSEKSTGKSAAVTVASNLPDGDAPNAGGDSESQAEKTREVLAYRYSETVREQFTEAGGVDRIGVAVLVNDIATLGENGETQWEQRSGDELNAIEELVKSAIAFDPDRGDVVTIESMQFAEVPVQGTLAETSTVDQFFQDNLGSLIQLGVLAVVVLALGLFVVRPILTAKAEAEAEAEANSLALDAQAALAAEGMTIGPDGEPVAIEGAAQPQIGADGEPMDMSMLEMSHTTMEGNELQLNEMVNSRSEESIALIKKWLSEEEVDEQEAA